MDFGCCLLFDRVVVSLTYPPFPFSILPVYINAEFAMSIPNTVNNLNFTLKCFFFSVKSFFHKYLSAEAQKYIRETDGFSSLLNEISASTAVQTSPPSNSSDEVLTVATGMASIPIKLLKEFLRASIR